MKISFITTVLNEESSIGLLLDSLLAQSRLPDEVIVADGGSKDKTVYIIERYIPKFKEAGVSFELIRVKGNRSTGRNAAIKESSGEIILSSDAGNILSKDWVKNLLDGFADKDADVIAGYYKGKTNNIFQKCLVPYVLVMPDKIDKNNFLPAARSIAFRRSVWDKTGGFPEKFSHNEDFVFAKKLKEMRFKIVFYQRAIVYWLPRNNFKEAFVMFFRFAYGDAEAGILRPKVVLIFLRYIVFFFIFIYSILYFNLYILGIIFLLFFAYIIWAIRKNYKYVNDIRGVVYLPLLQFVSDAAVIAGTSAGLAK